MASIPGDALSAVRSHYQNLPDMQVRIRHARFSPAGFGFFAETICSAIADRDVVTTDPLRHFRELSDRQRAQWTPWHASIVQGAVTCSGARSRGRLFSRSRRRTLARCCGCVQHAVVAAREAGMILVARDQHEHMPAAELIAATWGHSQADNFSPIIDVVGIRQLLQIRVGGKKDGDPDTTIRKFPKTRTVITRRLPSLPSSFYEVWFRTAELARPLASALFSRRTWEMEKLIERANLRQIKFRE
jgi:hypothetical protein